MSAVSNENKRRRVAIVGGGVAGLSAAYFLEENRDFEPTLYERLDRLGGNAVTMAGRSPDGRTLPIDPVVYLFVRQRYPYFTQWIDQLGIETRPLSFDSYLWDGHLGYGTLITSNIGKILRAGEKSLRYVRNLLQLKMVLRTIEKLERANKLDDRLTMGDFIKQVRFITPEFVNDIFYPQLHFAFHSSHADMASQPCGSILRTWASVAKDPGASYCIKGGVKTYIDVVHKALQSTRVRLGAEVVSVALTASNPPQWEVATADGARDRYDDVIMALLPAQAAEVLRRGLAAPDLQDAQTCELAKDVDVLSRVEQAVCRAAIHNDAGLMPLRRSAWPTYSYKYAPYLKTGLNTIWSGQADKADVFVSYDWSDTLEGVQDDRLVTQPRGTIHGVNIHCRTPPRKALYDMRDRLGARQGQSGLWFTGAHMRESGYHEDALAATFDVLKAMVPGGVGLTRLQALMTRVPAAFPHN